ncbi:MAG TPA: extracellular solute-binding protein [Planctomycetota bacterium]|nr:extracellular solute-binding protein [Planctomycetota bacterium]
MRRLVRTAAVVLLAALTALTACDNRGRVTTARTKQITFWHIQTSSVTREATADAVGRFESEHTDVAVQVSAFKNDPFKQKLSQAMASAAAPDVFHTWGGGRLEAFVREGEVADLTKAVEADNLTKRILPAALDFATFDDKVYAVPTDVAVVVMWYNRSIFEKHGIAPPATFDELKSVCVKLRRAGVAPIALGNKDKWPGAFYFIYLSTRMGGTRPFADAARRAPGDTFEHPSFIEAGRKLQELVNLRAFNDGVNVLSYDDARDLFINGKAAMMLMGTWFLADIRSDAPELLKTLDCFAFPTVADGRGNAGTIVGGINAAYAVSSRSAYPKEAFALLRELISEASAMKWAKTGRIPALKQEAVDGMLDETVLKAARLLFAAPEIQLYYDQYLGPRLSEMHKSTTQSLIAGTITPEEAAREMETLAREIAAKPKSDSP